MNSSELAKRIVNCLYKTDGEYKEKIEYRLYYELSQINNTSTIKYALLELCNRIDNLESEVG